jgi:hypothetical protein
MVARWAVEDCAKIRETYKPPIQDIGYCVGQLLHTIEEAKRNQHSPLPDRMQWNRMKEYADAIAKIRETGGE